MASFTVCCQVRQWSHLVGEMCSHSLTASKYISSPVEWVH